MDTDGAGLSHEINTDSRYVALGVCIVRKPQQQARFSDSGVTDEEELEKIVVSARTLRLAKSTIPNEHDASLY